MSGIAEFVNARLSEYEAMAREAASDDQAQWVATDLEPAVYVADSNMPVAVGPWGGPMDKADADHIVRHDPFRVLREIEAGRRLLASLKRAQEDFDKTLPGDYHRHGAVLAAWTQAARQRAAIWSDHPDYDPAWAPPLGTQEEDQ